MEAFECTISGLVDYPMNVHDLFLTADQLINNSQASALIRQMSPRGESAQFRMRVQWETCRLSNDVLFLSTGLDSVPQQKAVVRPSRCKDLVYCINLYLPELAIGSPHWRI